MERWSASPILAPVPARRACQNHCAKPPKTAAAPTASADYALSRALPDSGAPAFIGNTHKAEAVFSADADGTTVPADRARGIVTAAIRDKSFDKPEVFGARQVF